MIVSMDILRNILKTGIYKVMANDLVGQGEEVLKWSSSTQKWYKLDGSVYRAIVHEVLEEV